ncbi:MAG: hypothetical protein ACRC33_26470, partial [Gemmataceae bacterium]
TFHGGGIMKKVLQVLTAAVALAVPAFAVCAFAQQAGEGAPLAPKEFAVSGLFGSTQSAEHDAIKAGQLPAEVLTRQWTETSKVPPKPSKKG